MYATISSLGAALMLAGCAMESGPYEIPVGHPANPQATEVAYVPPSSVLALEVKAAVPIGTNAAPVVKNGQASTKTPADHSEHAQPAPAAQPKAPEPKAPADHSKHVQPTPASQPKAAKSKAPADHSEHAQPAPTAQPKAAEAKPDEHAGHDRKTIEVSHATQEQIDALNKAYLALSAMLAEDKIQGAGDQFVAIRQATKALSEAKEAAVKPLAEKVAKATPQMADDLEGARSAFKGLSEAVIELSQVAPPSKKVAAVVYQVNCPHAKASWLQLGEKIANPYFGSEMLRCGKVTQKIQPAEGHQQ